MRNLLYAILIGLIGAAVLHIVVILAVPVYSGLDTYARVLDLSDSDNFTPMPDQAGPGGLVVSGPFVKEGVCAFSTSDGPVLLTAEGSVPFWSVSVFDSGSNEAFSMNDRTSVNGTMKIIVGSEAEIAELKNSASVDLTDAILVVLPTSDGYAALRALAPQKSLEAAANSFLTAASCNNFSTQQATQPIDAPTN